MKNEDSISASLGVTHGEMAMLLGISRSLWTLFEQGKRALPLAATVKLTELLAHKQAAKDVVKPSPRVSQTNTKQFESLLRKTEYQLMSISRKISATEKKQSAQRGVQLLSAYLSDGDKGTSKAVLANAIAGRARQAAGNDVSDALSLLQYRQEVLEFEKQLIESKLRALRE